MTMFIFVFCCTPPGAVMPRFRPRGLLSASLLHFIFLADRRARTIEWIEKVSNNYWVHGIMGRRFPDGGLLRYRKWVPQQLGDVNKQESGDSRPMGARHGDTAANHTDLLSGCGQTCVFAVQSWSNLWDIISEPPSHYSMLSSVAPWLINSPPTISQWSIFNLM